jgi:hypothetical protein
VKTGVVNLAGTSRIFSSEGNYMSKKTDRLSTHAAMAALLTVILCTPASADVVSEWNERLQQALIVEGQHVSTALPTEGISVRVIASRPRPASEGTLRSWCGDKGDFDACTRFVEHRLNLRCRPDSDGSWRIVGSAEFRPIILLMSIDQLRHERHHISDIRASTEQYVRRLSEMTYTSSCQCEGAAAREQSAFARRLLEFARQSTLRRDPR